MRKKGWPVRCCYNTGSPAGRSVMTWGGGWEEGREAQQGGDICILMADLCIVGQKPLKHCKAIFF